MSIKYKDSNGTIEDVAGGLTADMAQTMIDDSMSITNGLWTLNNAYVTSGSVSWQKYGRIVIVTIANVGLATWSDGDKELSTNAGPIPISHSYTSIPALNGSTNQVFAVDASGRFVANGGKSNTGAFYGSFSYLAKE